MTSNSNEYKGILTTETGGLDYRAYDFLARKARSECFINLFLSSTKDEKDSLDESSYECSHGIPAV